MHLYFSRCSGPSEGSTYDSISPQTQDHKTASRYNRWSYASCDHRLEAVLCQLGSDISTIHLDIGMSVLVKLGLERQATMEPNFRRSCSKSTGFLGTWSCPRHLVSQLLDPTASRATWYCMPDSRHAWLGLLGWERDDEVHKTIQPRLTQFLGYGCYTLPNFIARFPGRLNHPRLNSTTRVIEAVDE